MNYWKITNKCASKVRLAVTVGPAQSRGAILLPGDSIICQPQRTPTMDAQIRRGFVDLDNNFDKNLYESIDLGKVYTSEEMNQKKMNKAAEDASQYVDKNK